MLQFPRYAGRHRTDEKNGGNPADRPILYGLYHISLYYFAFLHSSKHPILFSKPFLIDFTSSGHW
jgi:hypothetical protein